MYARGFEVDPRLRCCVGIALRLGGQSSFACDLFGGSPLFTEPLRQKVEIAQDSAFFVRCFRLGVVAASVASRDERPPSDTNAAGGGGFEQIRVRRDVGGRLRWRRCTVSPAGRQLRLQAEAAARTAASRMSGFFKCTQRLVVDGAAFFKSGLVLPEDRAARRCTVFNGEEFAVSCFDAQPRSTETGR